MSTLCQTAPKHLLNTHCAVAVFLLHSLLSCSCCPSVYFLFLNFSSPTKLLHSSSIEWTKCINAMQPHKWAAQKDLCFESWVQCSSINTLISAAGTFVSFAADFTPKLSIFVYYSRPATMRQQLHWVCHNLRINNWNFNRPMTVILSRQLSNSWCLCQQHVKTIWLKFGKLFSTSIQGLLDWVPLSFSVETFSLSVENIFLSPQKKVCSRSWVSWMISIFV